MEYENTTAEGDTAAIDMVLILVLMEYENTWGGSSRQFRIRVLILVLMEYENTMQFCCPMDTACCLNPCFNGIRKYSLLRW